MNKTFIVKESGREWGRFSLSISRKGVTYSYISGNEPCWQEVACAAACMLDDEYVPMWLAKRLAGNTFSLKRENCGKDTRARTYLIETQDSGSCQYEYLPMTLDIDRILEPTFHMDFAKGVKVLLATVMEYPDLDNFIYLSQEKLDALNEGRGKVYSYTVEVEKRRPVKMEDRGEFKSVVERERRESDYFDYCI